jgi:hypothetical protein
MRHKTPRSAAALKGRAGRAGNWKELGGAFNSQHSEASSPQQVVAERGHRQADVVDLDFVRLSRALLTSSHPRGSYQKALARQQAIRRNARTGPARLVVGFLRILLVIEGWPPLGWRVLDYFSLASKSDRDLLLVTAEMQRVGYPSENDVKPNLSPAVFSPDGAKDREAKAAMARLGRRGFKISNQVVAIRDPKFLWFADGGPGRSRSQREGA